MENEAHVIFCHFGLVWEPYFLREKKLIFHRKMEIVYEKYENEVSKLGLPWSLPRIFT
jgi:hypothetical protein